MSAPTMPPIPPPAAPPDLRALPAPRRRGRRLTLSVMALTTVVCALVAARFLPDARYAASMSTAPLVIDDPANVLLGPDLTDTWARFRGRVEPSGIEYGRLLTPGRFRLAPLAERPDLWVDYAVPEGVQPFVPPRAFVGRLVPLRTAGPRYGVIQRTMAGATPALPEQGWLLIDGDSPRGSRWMIAVVSVLGLFAAFNVWGITHLLRPLPHR